ncbi:hypothetical protein [Nonomuraea sp. NPDC049758]|uniref:carbohydrate ABC transporter permease n=1 Tax=Nonomuraea sp. NPDC049758 TaxID=3154360 RepID=UPI0034233E6A
MSICRVPSITTADDRPFGALCAKAGEPYVIPRDAANTAGGLEFLRAMLADDSAAGFIAQAGTLSANRRAELHGDARHGLVSINAALAEAGDNVFGVKLDTRNSRLWNDIAMVMGRFMNGDVKAAQLATEAQRLTDAARRRGGRSMRNRHQSRIILGFLAAPVLLYTVFVASPYVQAFYSALTDWRGLSAELGFVGLGNFAELAGDPVFWKALGNNVILLVTLPLVTIRAGVVPGLPAQRRGRPPRQGVDRDHRRVVDERLQPHQRPAQRRAAGRRPRRGAAVVARRRTAGLLGRARRTGLERRRIWENIRTAAVYLGIAALDAIAVVQIMTGGGPNDSTQVGSFYLHQNAFSYGRFGYASAMGVVLFGVTLARSAFTLSATRRERIEF